MRLGNALGPYLAHVHKPYTCTSNERNQHAVPSKPARFVPCPGIRMRTTRRPTRTYLQSVSLWNDVNTEDYERRGAAHDDEDNGDDNDNNETAMGISVFFFP